MNYWLLKTEPDCYSLSDLERDKQTVWDGVKNNLALKYLRQIKKGDLAVIYHTGDERAAVGLAHVVSDAYADAKLHDPRLVVVDIKAGQRLAAPVTLAAVKANAAFKDCLLLKMPRLSVMPLTQQQWQFLAKDAEA